MLWRLNILAWYMSVILTSCSTFHSSQSRCDYSHTLLSILKSCSTLFYTFCCPAMLPLQTLVKHEWKPGSKRAKKRLLPPLPGEVRPSGSLCCVWTASQHPSYLDACDSTSQRRSLCFSFVAPSVGRSSSCKQMVCLTEATTGGDRSNASGKSGTYDSYLRFS